jgi:hypothetical protein
MKTPSGHSAALSQIPGLVDGKGYREISRQVLNEYRAQSVAPGAAASSTNLELAVLRRGLRRAEEEGLVDHKKAEAGF